MKHIMHLVLDTGICGKPRMVDVGGPPNLCPLADKTKLYDMCQYPSLTEVGGKEQLVIGPGACPYTFFTRNGEMIANLTVTPERSVGTQKTRVARTYDEDGSHKVFELPREESKNSLLGNFMISEGEPGQVLDIVCKKRIGPDNFVTAMRKVLCDKYPDKFIGLGGTFVVLTGKIKIHVMPDYSQCPLDSDEKVNEWLKFYEAKTPFPCVSVFYNRDPVRHQRLYSKSVIKQVFSRQGMDLRIEHSHGYNFQGEGGHYHYDITPDEVEYRGIYTLGESEPSS